MYTSFHVKNFRGFEDLELNDLARINLIAGKNNVGKTALLEALFLFSGGYKLDLIVTIQGIRGLVGDASQWDTIFRNFDNLNAVEISGEDAGRTRNLIIEEVTRQEKILELARSIKSEDNGFAGATTSSVNLRVLELKYHSSDGDTGNHFLVQDQKGVHGRPSRDPAVYAHFLNSTSARFSNEDAEHYRKLAKLKQESRLLDALRIIEPRLERTLTLPEGANNIMLYGDVGLNQLLPIAVMGQGIIRLTGIILALSDAENGVVLIDEIENGLHYSILTDVWKAIAVAAREFNVQIFATTHSLEMIRAAHEAFKEQEPYDFRYHRLDRSPLSGAIYATTYNEDSMNAVINLNAEVRG